MDDDYEIDETVFDKEKRSKKKNSKDKGNRGERSLVAILNKRFKTECFSRTVGSGNRWSQIAYTAKHYISDLVCPEGFKYIIECKFGYDIELCQLFAGKNGHEQLNRFFAQADDEAKRAEKSSLVCWKKDRQPWLTFLKSDALPRSFNYSLKYREWTGIGLNDLLLLEDSFFFL